MGQRSPKGKVSCKILKKVEKGEHFFILRGKDKLSPLLIRLWANLAHHHGASKETAFEARQIADRMECDQDTRYPG